MMIVGNILIRKYCGRGAIINRNQCIDYCCMGYIKFGFEGIVDYTC